MFEAGLDIGSRRDTASRFSPMEARRSVSRLLLMARGSRHIFLIYLLGLVLEEIRNIENGRSSEL